MVTKAQVNRLAALSDSIDAVIGDRAEPDIKLAPAYCQRLDAAVGDLATDLIVESVQDLRDSSMIVHANFVERLGNAYLAERSKR